MDLVGAVRLKCSCTGLENRRFLDASPTLVTICSSRSWWLGIWLTRLVNSQLKDTERE